MAVARALALNPSLIVCDEPVSALDVSIQAQILNLFNRLKDDFGLSYLFISHDLGVVEHIADRIAVMYLGKVVELNKESEICRNPRHPYTQALMAAIPIPMVSSSRKQRKLLSGNIPSPIELPAAVPSIHDAPRPWNDAGRRSLVRCLWLKEARWHATCTSPPPRADNALPKGGQMEPTTVQKISRLVCALQPEDIPGPVLDKAAWCALDLLGASMAGFKQPSASAARRDPKKFFPIGPAGVWFLPTACPPWGQPFVTQSLVAL